MLTSQPTASTRISRPGRSGRVVLQVGWMILTVLAVQGFVCALALFPVLWIWLQMFALTESSVVRTVAASILAVPSYVLFALLLMFVSALTTRLLGWRTHAGAEMSIAALERPLVNWVRIMIATHIVRVGAGALFRGSPIWTAYLRLAGARLGRRVYVNSLSLSDYNLLEFGDDVVIGEHVHLSGHTVEGGVVKTARVKLGSNVMIGLGSVIDIDVEIGDNCQVGALTFVPKHTRLASGAMYGGIPVRRIG